MKEAAWSAGFVGVLIDREDGLWLLAFTYFYNKSIIDSYTTCLSNIHDECAPLILWEWLT